MTDKIAQQNLDAIHRKLSMAKALAHELGKAKFTDADAALSLRDGIVEDVDACLSYVNQLRGLLELE